MYSDTGFVSQSAWNLDDIGQRGSPHIPLPLQTEQREGIVYEYISRIKI